MQHQSVTELGLRLPFLWHFIEDVDFKLYEEAIADSELLKDTYDPITQTSRISIHAAKGTSLTYRDTYCGIMYPSDQKQCDS